VHAYIIVGVRVDDWVYYARVRISCVLIIISSDGIACLLTRLDSPCLSHALQHAVPVHHASHHLDVIEQHIHQPCQQHQHITAADVDILVSDAFYIPASSMYLTHRACLCSIAACFSNAFRPAARISCSTHLKKVSPLSLQSSSLYIVTALQ
jgi:hypothetical protein